MIGEKEKRAYLHALLPRSFWKAKGEWIDAGGKHPFRPVVLGYIGEILEMIAGGLGLCFYGPYGSGKTYLGCLILKEAILKGKTALYITLYELTENQKRFFNDYGMIYKLIPNAHEPCPYGDFHTVGDQARQVDILLIDDVLIDEKGLPFPQLDCLRDILRCRRVWRKATILTVRGERGNYFRYLSEMDREMIEKAGMKLVEVDGPEYWRIRTRETQERIDDLIDEGLEKMEESGAGGENPSQ